jgi:hypothetical protein
MLLFWNPIMFATGYYLMAVSGLMDGAAALAAPTATSAKRRSQFRVIQGGKC